LRVAHRRPRFRFAISVVAAVVMLAVPAGVAPAVAVPATNATMAPSFGNPTISGIQGTGFEQNVRLDRSGRIYTSAPGTIAAAVSFMYRSLDSGQTFKLVPAAIQPHGKLALTCPAGGGDTELATDSANNLYFNDLYAANFATARSSDQGRTFTSSSCISAPSSPDDRQWYAVDGNPLAGGSITLAYNVPPNLTPLPNPNACLNNILVFARSPVVLPQTAGTQFGPVQPLNVPCDDKEGIMGNDEVFTYPSGTRAFVIHDNDPLTQIRMGRCDLVPFTTSTTGYSNCTDRLISSFPAGRTGANFPTLSIDRSGNLFAVWEQAGYNSGASEVTSDTLLYYAVSTDQGENWSTPRILPTPNLLTNVFAWPAAGDAGRVDVAFYGTSASACTSVGHCGKGPDSVNGDWSLYVVQSLNVNSLNPTWSQPVQASEHFIHRGSIQTLIGSQSGDRTLGDFLTVRPGLQGEAVISYSDSNSITHFHAAGPSSTQGLPQGMFVRQNGGASLFRRVGSVRGPRVRINSVQVGDHPASLDSAGISSSDQPNLKLLGSQVSSPDASTYQVRMLVSDLRSLAPKTDIVPFGANLVWNTQWKVPSSSDPNGGAFFHAYMESTNGGSPTFWVGQDAAESSGGGVNLTYPGSTQLLTGSYTPTAPGVITINIPKSAVGEPGAISDILYSVTSSSMTLAAPAESVPSLGGAGGLDFSLVDVAPAYDFNPGQSTPPFSSCPEGDGNGTVHGQGGGTASFEFDGDRCEDQDQESVQERDGGAGTDFHSTSIQSKSFDRPTGTMTMLGAGVNAGHPVTFVMVVVDNGSQPGAFSLALSDGYAITGTLLSGSIQLL
jgi:hypothetical protein